MNNQWKFQSMSLSSMWSGFLASHYMPTGLSVFLSLIIFTGFAALVTWNE